MTKIAIGMGVCDVQELLDESSTMDKGSYKTHLKSPLDVLWNGFIGLTNILELVNRGPVSMPIEIELYSISGELLQTVPIEIDTGGQFDLIVSDMAQFQRDSFGIVRIKFDEVYNDFLDGRMSFYRGNFISGYEFAFSVPFEQALLGNSAVTFNTYQPSLNPLEIGNQVAQWLSIVNLDELDTKTFTVKRYGQAGNLLVEDSFSVPPFGRIDIEGGHVSPGVSQVGLHVIEPADQESPYIAQLFRYWWQCSPQE